MTVSQKERRRSLEVTESIAGDCLNSQYSETRLYVTSNYHAFTRLQEAITPVKPHPVLLLLFLFFLYEML
jgi:hypothetical protein